MTTTDLMTDLNWRTMVMQMSARDISITSRHFGSVLAQLLVLTGKLHFVARVQFDFGQARPGPVQYLRRQLPERRVGFDRYGAKLVVVRDGDKLRLDFDGRETLEGNGFPVRGWGIKAANLFRLAALLDAATSQNRDEPVALPQFGQLQAGKGGLGHPADLLIVQAQRIGAVLVNGDFNIGHAQAQVIEDMIAARRPQFGRGLVG